MQQVTYKKPRAINGVSIVILLVMGVLGWVGYSLWPVMSLASAVKSEMGDALPRIYTANLRSEPLCSKMINETKAALLTALRKAGVKDKDLQIIVKRDKKSVALEVKYTVVGVLAGVDKSHTFHMNPKVETDAARVEW